MCVYTYFWWLQHARLDDSWRLLHVCPWAECGMLQGLGGLQCKYVDLRAKYVTTSLPCFKKGTNIWNQRCRKQLGHLVLHTHTHTLHNTGQTAPRLYMYIYIYIWKATLTCLIQINTSNTWMFQLRRITTINMWQNRSCQYAGTGDPCRCFSCLILEVFSIPGKWKYSWWLSFNYIGIQPFQWCLCGQHSSQPLTSWWFIMMTHQPATGSTLQGEATAKTKQLETIFSKCKGVAGIMVDSSVTPPKRFGSKGVVMLLWFKSTTTSTFSSDESVIPFTVISLSTTAND